MSNSQIYDIVIIGAGPVGLFAAHSAGSRGYSVALVDAMPGVGGQLTALYPKKYIFDVAGYPRVTAEELVDELHEQARQYDPRVSLLFKVTDLQRQENGEYRIVAEDGRELYGRYVVIAAGAGIITPRKLGLPEEEKYAGNGLEYVVRDIDGYRDARVLVVGGGDTALDWANYFNEISREVTLIHRRDHFSCFEGSLHKLQDSTATIHTFAKLTSISGNGKVEHAEIANTKESWSKSLDLDRILVCVGFVPKLGFLKEGDLEVAHSSVVADRKLRTNLDSVYVVGDIANHPGRIKLISTGFGNVATVLNDIAEREHREKLAG